LYIEHITISASYAQVLKEYRPPVDAARIVEVRSITRPPPSGDPTTRSPLDVHATAALDRLTRWAAQALRAPVALVSLVDAEGHVVTTSDALGDIAAAPGTAELCELVVATREPHAIADVRAGRAAHDDADPVAFVGAPLIDSTGHVLGCLCVTDTRPRPWSIHDIALVKELSISATTELELRIARAMAEREQRWSEGQQAVLELIAARAPLQRTLTELLHVSESHAPGLLASILLLERESGGRRVLRYAAGPSLPRSFTSAIDSLEVGERQGICGTAAHRREPVIVMDVTTDPLTAPYIALCDAHDLRAGWATPILSSSGAVLGTFTLYYRPSRLPKPSDEIVIDRSIHLARLAIEQCQDARMLRRSATQARALAREQTALQRVATSVAAETDPEILFALVSEQVGLLLRAERGCVLRFVDDDRYRTMGSWGRDGAAVQPVGEVDAHSSGGLCAELRRGRPAKRRSVHDASHELAGRHRIAAPIVVDGRPWGMVVAQRDRFGAFPREDEKRIARFAQLASLAVANAYAHERLAAQALTDSLTGLANRRAFDHRLGEETERALRHGRALSLMLVDVDHFKAINDRFGHATGDRVLVNLAGDLRTVMRHGDLLARIGGDEMAMILADCPHEQALDVAHRMLAAIAANVSLAQRHGVTLSIGVAGLTAGRSADDLLRCADQALYRAKDGGRNRVVSYEREVTHEVRP
jgi:diguanylate cyclase (GGDEF)-like protein